MGMRTGLDAPSAVRTPATRARPRGCATRSHELKERIKVLERITVEKENSLAKEIESLRDR